MVTIPSRVSTYFTCVLLLFVGSFLILPTAKMVNNVYYALMLLPACLALFTKWGHRIVLSAEAVFWMLLLAWTVFISVRSGEPLRIKDVIYVAIFVLTISHYISPTLFRSPIFGRIQFWAIISYVVGATIFDWITGKYGIGEKILWLPSRMDGPNFTSMYIAACFALALPNWIQQRRHGELLAALFLSAFATGYALQSRSGVIGLLLMGLLVAAYFSTKSARHLKIVILSVAGIAALVAIGFVAMPEVAALFRRGDSLRFEIWTSLIADWQHCGIWLGCGMDFHSPTILSNGGLILHPHNIFLAFGIYSGLVALLLFSVLMCLTLRRAWIHSDPWGLYLVVALFCLNFDGSKLISNPDERWLLVLLPSALIINRRADSPLKWAR